MIFTKREGSKFATLYLIPHKDSIPKT